MSSISLMPTISVQVAGVTNLAALPAANTLPIGSIRVTLNDGALYVSDGTTWNPAGGGGGGGVTSVNGLTGIVTVQVGDGTIGSSGATNRFTIVNGTGELVSYDTVQTNSEDGINVFKAIQPDNEAGNTYSNWNLNFEPLQNSPNEAWNSLSYYYNIDPNLSGFSFGTAGEAVVHAPVSFNAQGSGDLGALTFTKNNFQVGNGTDPFDWRGMGYSFGFGNIAANVNLTENMQGYGYQWSMNALATTDSVFSTGFYDFCNIACAWDGSWSSFASGPTIAEITNGNNYTALNINPNITLCSGNSGVYGVAINPTIGNMGYGSTFSGVSVSPQTSTVYNAYGININLDNVTTFAGAAASLVFQDLTFTRNDVGEDGNSISMEYIGGGTAGSEVVSNIGLAYTVQIETGVSTATQVKAALDGDPTWSQAITTTISGVGSNPQVVGGPTNLAGGLWAGQKLAGFFDGDVQITGSLSFSGALSIGALNSFASQAIPNGAGVYSISTLITNPTVAANATLTGTDLLGVNTAMLLSVGDNASVTTTFLGLAALGLPAVVTMGAGSTVDRVGGAAFAVSLDAGSTGGTINTFSLCRALALPNGSTTVNRSYGYEYDMPFGIVGTTAFGLYITQNVNNWIEGSLRIGGTTISADTTTYDFHVDGDSFFDGDIGFFGTTPVAQQASSGAATAGGTYTATEQAMLQEAYDALRAYGLLT